MMQPLERPFKLVIGLWLVVAVVVLILLIGWCAAHAAELDRHSWFKSLMQPDKPMVSCCDVSDCHQTQAEQRGSDWWAVVEDH